MPLQIVTPTPPDIEIAQAVKCRPITEIAAKIGLTDNDYEPHGHDKAKVRKTRSPGILSRCRLCLPAAIENKCKCKHGDAVATLLLKPNRWGPTATPAWEAPAAAPLAPFKHPMPAHRPQVKLCVIDKLKDQPNGKYIVVAGMTPTPLGEGKR